MYYVYQTSLIDKNLLGISEEVNIAMQTDPVKVCDSYIMADTTTASSINVCSPTKRHSISSDGNTLSENNNN